MNTKPRYLTKSRFKLALSCPTKLFYTRKKEYENNSDTDSFLQGLAQGGFQVEELARLYHSNGHAILGDDYDYNKLVARTNKLLEQDNVTIFEPAFLYDGLFIRVDILVKKGNTIKLIEVKAKSINGNTHESYISKNGKNLSAGMQPYLYDIAFQQYVIQQCHPEWTINAYLNLVDKSKYTTVNGLNAHFKIDTNANLRTNVKVTEGLTKEDVGEPILSLISVIDEVEFIFKNNPHQPELSFTELIKLYKTHYDNDIKIATPISANCEGCEFKNTNPTTEQRSGYHECWHTQLPNLRPDLKITDDLLNSPKTRHIWNNPAKEALKNHKYFTADLTEDDLNIKAEAYGLSRSERQWLQIEKTNTNDTSIYVDKDNLKLEMSQWVYPLNFIDFETSAVAIPFTSGMRPYEQLAFQFSHHMVSKDGTVAHQSEYINLEPGVFPNFEFIRALKRALEQNVGSVFRYHNHENTIVNVIYNQLIQSDEPDKKDLLSFIESISHNTGSNANTWRGKRDMIDLQRTVVKNYFHPQTGGSNSIKAILPAVLESSAFLKEKYTKPLDAINLSSLNFDKEYEFLQFKDGVAQNPYSSLPPLFKGVSNEELEAAIEHASNETHEIKDGGAALFAYARLQDTSVSTLERDETRKALLRYCELDTLAMVMIYEHFMELIS